MNHLAAHNNINHIKKFIHNNYDNNDVVTNVHNHLVFCTKKKTSRFTGNDINRDKSQFLSIIDKFRLFHINVY